MDDHGAEIDNLQDAQTEIEVLKKRLAQINALALAQLAEAQIETERLKRALAKSQAETKLERLAVEQRNRDYDRLRVDLSAMQDERDGALKLIDALDEALLKARGTN